MPTRVLSSGERIVADVLIEILSVRQAYEARRGPWAEFLKVVIESAKSELIDDDGAEVPWSAREIVTLSFGYCTSVATQLKAAIRRLESGYPNERDAYNQLVELDIPGDPPGDVPAEKGVFLFLALAAEREGIV